jgi:chloride channel protein, CIC family
MSTGPDPSAEPEAGRTGLIMLAVLAVLVGACAGITGGLFRIALGEANQLRGALIAWAHGKGVVGFLIVILTCAAGVAIAAWLVRRFSPQAAGSGIPHVEAVLDEEIPDAAFRLIWVKFIGGVLAIGSGLALGREGPSVQMSASIAHLIGRLFNRSWPDCRVLVAAGAGAGLATAFNAPIGGAVFVLEELVRRFEPRIAIAALGSSVAAIIVSRTLTGDAPDFHLAHLAYDGPGTRLLYLGLGAVAGLFAIAYNHALLAAQAWSDSRGRRPTEFRAGVLGALVGAVAWFAPDLVGGGDPMTQRTLLGAVSLTALPLLFLFRFALGTFSYAVRTPGGLFAPILVLGAQIGLACGMLCQSAFPHLHVQPEGFAVVGMAAFFTGVVRAPLTGIVLVVEMTSDVTMMLPMLAACFVAMLTPTLLGDKPIYDSLRERMLRVARDRALPAT